MAHINNLIKLHTPKDSTNKQRTPTSRWSLDTQKAVLGLFARFSDLYGALAQSKGLEIYRENSSEFTREYQLWCLKLDAVDMEGIARGVENLEKQIEENAKNGEKSWPPSYAEFRGLCYKAEAKACHKQHIAIPAPKMSKAERSEKMRSVLDSVGSLKYKGEQE